MEYTINGLSNLAKVSKRTLRYYDEIDLLKPSRINSSGYRIYGEKEVNRLQQIMFYKEMDLSLLEIKNILNNPKYDLNKALENHYNNLILKRERLDKLILNIEKTIANNKGEITMKNREKFEGFKKEKLEENEKRYGKEIREKYGEDTINKSNNKFLNLSEEDFNKMGKTEKEMIEALIKVCKGEDLNLEEEKKVYEKHKEWLKFTWHEYSKEAHRGLSEMYVFDERFSKYYNDKCNMDVVKTLRDIIFKYTE